MIQMLNKVWETDLVPMEDIHNMMLSKDRVPMEDIHHTMPIKNREKNLVHTMPSKDLVPMEDIQHGMPSMNREKNIQNQKTCTTMPVWMRTSEAMKFENFISFYRTIPV